MTVLENISLKPFTTFGIDVKARYFADFSDTEELAYLLDSYKHSKKIIIGEGSNLLFTEDFDGLVMRNSIKGFEVLERGAESVTLRVGAGEHWHQFVVRCLSEGFYGLENLSLIYGTVGASPMQNIGAYGVEVRQYIKQVLAYHLKTGELHTFSNEDCAFGYRTSVFKQEKKGQYCIVAVDFVLPTVPCLRLAYGDIQTTLQEMGIDSPTPHDVSKAVIHIRQSKLPNPAELGNAGSFFKNPEIPLAQFEALKARFPSLPSYPAQTAGEVKIPAGWLIEQAGWKGHRRGDAGVHQRQALVLVNYAGAQGAEIRQLAQDIEADVWDKFGVRISPEVNIV